MEWNVHVENDHQACNKLATSCQLVSNYSSPSGLRP